MIEHIGTKADLQSGWENRKASRSFEDTNRDIKNPLRRFYPPEGVLD